ncbi:acyltransferase family protein [Burkholderia savannae]|uniref:acyltransferase family protein n=1 Tax=Burkholderia savannae TaxID=1637837 RepID=UPI0009EC8C50|nr:acyltransferase family protein [Burkholderia savannae]
MSNPPPKVSSLIYRPDIDGLRAIAVTSVLLFHAFPGVVSGGFVGVDIFFVISGYLITSILVDEVRGNRFSIATFYARRARRIFPALVAVLATVLVIGWGVLVTDELRELGKHIAAGAGFVSNLVLWSETGYFDRAAEFKPLLHLWSLGVEEQFYILWPLALALTHRSRAALVATVMLIFSASFALNIGLVANHPSAAFFSPFTRFWELMIGSMLTLNADRLQRAPHALRSLASIVGAILCAIAVFGLNGAQSYPGWRALLPTLGAALLIAGGVNGFANQALKRPIMVWIGKISYPLYLWHWPLLSFAAIVAGAQPAAPVRTALLLASVLLAWLTYRLIETPVRHHTNRMIAIATPSCALLVAGSIGAFVFLAAPQAPSQLYSRYGDIATATHGAGHEFISTDCGIAENDLKGAVCAFDKRNTPRFAMIGDSKAEAVIWGFLRESQPDSRWKFFDRSGCVPLTGIVRTSSYADDNPKDCTQFAQLEIQHVAADPNIKLVTIATASRMLFGPDYANAQTLAPDKQGPLHGLDGTIRVLEGAGKRVALLVDNPTLPDPHDCMERSAMRYRIVRALASPNENACTLSYRKHLETTKEYRVLVDQLQKNHPNLLVLDATPILCDIRNDTCPISKDGNYLYSYGDHVSDYASTMIAHAFLPKLVEAVR